MIASPANLSSVRESWNPTADAKVECIGKSREPKTRAGSTDALAGTLIMAIRMACICGRPVERDVRDLLRTSISLSHDYLTQSSIQRTSETATGLTVFEKDISKPFSQLFAASSSCQQ
jgi:hypothetical protein